MEAESRSQRQVRRDHVAVEIIHEDNLVFSIKERIESVALKHSICRVSRILEKHYKEHEAQYFPKLVSIGPLHHGKEVLKDMEDKKWCYLNTLLNRKPNVEMSLDSCVKALRYLEDKARKCYGEKIEMGSDEFVQMMLVDGCFIIELLFKYSIKGLRRRDDPFFITNDRFYDLKCDIILLENQIPFFVLQRLFSLVPIPKQCTQSLAELALRFFKKWIPGDVQVLPEKFSQDFNHLLDLVFHCYLPTFSEVQSNSGTQQSLANNSGTPQSLANNSGTQQSLANNGGTPQSLANAKKLQGEGISFEKANTESLLDMKFVDGVLKMPPLTIHRYTEVVLRNLIALEHCYCDRKKYITSYAGLMKDLIQSKEDVRLLYQTRILTYGKETKREDIVALFKNLHVEMEVKDYYNGLREQVDRHVKTNWQAWCQKMKWNFRKTPLTVAGLILAILFLVLTFIGTLFSVLSFTHQF